MQKTNLIFCIYISAVTLLQWTFTKDPADPKMLILLISFPFLLWYGFLKSYDSSKNTSLSISIAPIFVFLLLLVYTIINWYIKSYPFHGNIALIFTWHCLISFIVGALFISKKDFFNKLQYYLILAVSAASLYVLLQFFGFIPTSLRYYPPEITGLVGHKNTFGFMVMVTLLWTLYMLITKEKLKNSQIISLAISFLLQFSAHLIADSRGSLFLSMAGLTIISIPLLISKGLLKKKNNRYVLYFIVLIICILPILLWNDTMWIRIGRLFIHSALPSTRFAFYEAQWKLFLSSPIFGVGVGNFISLHIPMLPDWFREWAPTNMLARNGHCDYLETLCELGLVGFVLNYFFWAGAIVIGVKKVLRTKNMATFVLLITLILMMIHAGFDTASRHLPASTLLWLILGYFWKDHFQTVCGSMTHKIRRYSLILINILHVIIFALFAQFIISDTLYYTFARGVGKPVKRLQTVLRINPNHSDALFQVASIAAQNKQYDFAIQCATHLDSVAPNIHTTDQIYGVCAYHKRDFAKALKYANSELYKRPNYLEAKVLKANALAHLGLCQELAVMQKIFTPRKTLPVKKQTNQPVLSKNEIREKAFIKKTGSLRVKLSGPFLKQSFDIYQYVAQVKSQKKKNMIAEILNLTCKEDTSHLTK